MIQASDKQKAKDFIDHLFLNPNIANEPLLIGEGLILNFFAQNLEQLRVTFKTPQFFPHLEWNQVLSIIVSDLFERTSTKILPLLDKEISLLDYDVMNSLSETGSFTSDFQKENLRSFVHAIFKNRDVRFNFNSTLTMFEHGIIEKYIREIFERRDSLFNELVRVQRTNLECEEYIIFIKFLLLIKNIAYIKINVSFKESGSRMNLNDVLKMPGKLPVYLDDVSSYIRQKLPMVSDKTVKLALKANLKENQVDIEDACSKLIFILSSRFHNYKPVARIDRGAESPDKSWFAIAMKNAEYYGFDRRMLDALYRIAGDNRW